MSLATKQRIVSQRWHATRRYILSTMPVLWVSMRKDDGGTGQFTSDDAYGHLCTVTGATWGSRGRTFDGNDLINIDSVLTSLAATTQGSWEIWGRMADSTPPAVSVLISFADAQAPIEVIYLYVNTDGKISFYSQIAGTIQWHVKTDSAPISDNTFFHIVGVQDAVSPIIYVNGNQPAQTFATSTDKTKWFSAGTNLDNGRIGCYNLNGGGNAGFLTGDVGEIRIYNRTLTSAEVQRNYLATKWRY